MYKLPYYHEEDEEIVKQFVRDHPFAFIAGSDAESNPVATQVPLFIDERDGKFFLTGHIMRNTDHHKAFVENENVLAIFTGPHSYVSATWYDNPYQASTWNFMSVHAIGIIRFGNDEELVAILKRLTLHYEDNNSSSTTIYDNLPTENTARLMKAIVAFEIEVTSLEHVFKLSQDRDEKSYDNIVDKLKLQGGDAEEIAVIMENRKSKVFKS
ncbi:MAG: FMN-binding negative transcriptional regulator [Chitinophagaceae bacterium]|nr:FMN-binding negative transcriptional regulator [Chitinophagaceae bacterium]